MGERRTRVVPEMTRRVEGPKEVEAVTNQTEAQVANYIQRVISEITVLQELVKGMDFPAVNDATGFGRKKSRKVADRLFEEDEFASESEMHMAELLARLQTLIKQANGVAADTKSVAEMIRLVQDKINKSKGE